MQWIAEVIHFWFEELAPKDWWSASPKIDETIRERFETLLELLERDPPELSDLDARGHLATVIAFDQFPRNLFRDSPEAFATDGMALTFTLDALDRGLDRELDEPQRQFLYMPLMHSEDPEIQERSLEQFGTLDHRAFRSAKQHYDTIARFGRFPYRNEALGRESTDEEREFLAKHPAAE
jgi:uncharacterized protein (DUF924 family)